VIWPQASRRITPLFGGESPKEDRPMARYKMKPGCIFVDANDYKTHDKKPDENPYPHVFSQEDGTYVTFNDTAGFIARFIALGVDTENIPQIMASEYGPGAVTNATQEVKDVYKMMKNYVEEMTTRKTHETPGPVAPIKLLPTHSRKLKLDFSTNPIGIHVIKVPTS
jgi:hypothetical protein